MSLHVRMFKPQFSPLVESGEKCQTVRPIPKRIPKTGDQISLRTWTGKPYRSKQRVLREATIQRVSLIQIKCPDFGLWIGRKKLSLRESETFARADGFKSLKEMEEWFKTEHGLPFIGIMIKWH